MGIGKKIKEYRNKIGYTQKDLADQLHVTYQAVSRWENDDVEPSIDTLKEMAKLFNCSIDDLFSLEKPSSTNDESTEEISEPLVMEEVVAIKEEDRTPVAVCEKCKKTLYKGDVHTYSEGIADEVVFHDLCQECYDARQSAIAKKFSKQFDNYFKLRRIHSFIWPGIVALTLLIFAIIQFVNGNAMIGGILAGSSVLSFTFIACWILYNNIIPEVWMYIASWSVRFPGIIFSLDLGGFVFFIVVKVIFVILGTILFFLALLLATAVSMVISLFVYPYAIVKNFRKKGYGEVH